MDQDLSYGRWEQLQESTRTPSDRGHLLRLLSALDVGWIIEQPVLRRWRWGESGTALFHFVLVQPDSGRRRLLTLPVTLELRQYLQGEDIQVR